MQNPFPIEEYYDFFSAALKKELEGITKLAETNVKQIRVRASTMDKLDNYAKHAGKRRIDGSRPFDGMAYKGIELIRM